MSNSDKEKRFTLRIDYDIFEKVKNSAQRNKRSISKEIEYILTQKLKEDDTK